MHNMNNQDQTQPGLLPNKQHTTFDYSDFIDLMKILEKITKQAAILEERIALLEKQANERQGN